jgi:hypothetical protein
MLRTRSIVVAATFGLAASLLATSPASSTPPYFETISEPLASHFEDYCGVEGLSVDQTGTFESRLKILTKKSGLDYFMEHITTEETLTGVESGRSVHIHTAFIAKDLKVVDNGNGTLTITQLLTGPSTVYGPDGKALARDPGQVRFLAVINTNGTPSDPSDDFEVSSELLKGSTGRSDDYCAAIVAAIS